MSVPMHAIAVPTVVRALKNLRHVLRAGEEHAIARQTDPQALLQARLIEDMHPLVRQVQNATDTAKNGLARLAAVEPLRFEDNETTFTQLYDRIDRAIAYIESFQPAQLNGSESREIVFQAGRWGELRFSGVGYMTDFMLPNFFFHCTTAYDILRKEGVGLGKRDYLGAL